MLRLCAQVGSSFFHGFPCEITGRGGSYIPQSVGELRERWASYRVPVVLLLPLLPLLSAVHPIALA